MRVADTSRPRSIRPLILRDEHPEQAVGSSAVPYQDAAVEVSGLVVRYGNLTAVDGVDLRADAGEVVALLGRNGAGKTSTVETLEGYRRRASGSVSVLGFDPGEREGARALSGRIGVMLQRGGVYPGMGPAEAVRLFSSFYESAEDPNELVGRMGLGDAVLPTVDEAADVSIDRPKSRVRDGVWALPSLPG